MDAHKNNDDDATLIDRAMKGDSRSIDELFVRHRERLKRMVRLRIDPRLRGRVDASDVVQEAYVEISQKLEDYLRERKLPFFLWLRLVTGQKLALAHRQHLGVKARDAKREISLFQGSMPHVSSAALAAQLMGRFTSPSQAAVKAELKTRVQEALNAMDPIDREVLSLRHFEQLANGETALLLGISETAACNRYVRALKRLKSIIAQMPGSEGG